MFTFYHIMFEYFFTFINILLCIALKMMFFRFYHSKARFIALLMTRFSSTIHVMYRFFHNYQSTCL